jgi:hypothetical protein
LGVFGVRPYGTGEPRLAARVPQHVEVNLEREAGALVDGTRAETRALAMRQQVLDSNGAVICSDLRSLIVQIHSALDVYRRTGGGTIRLTLRVVARCLSGGLACACSSCFCWYAAQPATAKASVQAVMIRTVGLQKKTCKL